MASQDTRRLRLTIVFLAAGFAGLISASAVSIGGFAGAAAVSVGEDSSVALTSPVVKEGERTRTGWFA